jgi:DNA (cytosine-5)-methyltransferase 1
MVSDSHEKNMRVLDLFSGIGGFSLGLERAGMTTVAFCEVDKKCQQVLAKHWPEVPVFDDVRTLNKGLLDEKGISVDVICGGFPCQDISLAGKGAGIEGERSGLWSEFARLIGELRPQFVIVENVSALLSRGLDRVLGDLASFGYDAEWHCIPASAVGAPHRRDRIWIVAYSNSFGSLSKPERDTTSLAKESEGKEGAEHQFAFCVETRSADVADPNSQYGRSKRPIKISSRRQTWDQSSGSRSNGSNTDSQGLEGRTQTIRQEKERNQDTRHFRPLVSVIRRDSQWDVEPNVGRVANGVPNRVDRLKQLGNAVVPQIPELIGKAIMAKKDPTEAGPV